MMSCEERIKAAVDYYEQSEQGGYVYMDMYDRLLEYQRIPHRNEWKKRARQVMMDEIPIGQVWAAGSGPEARFNSSDVLDWGCGRGTLGFLGSAFVGDRHGSGLRLVVDGYDLPTSGNRYTKINYLWQLKPKYDAIIASHIFEHCKSKEEVIETLRLMKIWSDRLIVAMPNMHHNPLLDFWCDDTHVFPYNTAMFFYYLELAGWKPVRVIKCDLPEYKWPFVLGRVAWNVVTHTSPFANWICVCERVK